MSINRIQIFHYFCSGICLIKLKLAHLMQYQAIGFLTKHIKLDLYEKYLEIYCAKFEIYFMACDKFKNDDGSFQLDVSVLNC